MPKFTGTDSRTVTIRAPKHVVIEMMSSPAEIKLSIDNLEHVEHVDDNTVRFIHNEVAEKGVKFRGDRTMRYEKDGDRLRWHTVSNGNMNCHGHARFTDAGDNETRVEFHETVECDMKVNRLLAKVFKPIVERHIRHGVGEYLDRVRDRAEAAS